MSDKRLETPFGAFTLERYPLDKKQLLQAWDGADSYLLTTVSERFSNATNILVCNDNFGALTVPLSARDTHFVSDSYCSQHAIALNLERASLEAHARQLDTIPELIDLVLIRVPKSLAQFEYQLSEISKQVPSGTPVLAAAMVKHLPHAAKDLMEQYLGPTQLSRAVKKARILETNIQASEHRYQKRFGFDWQARHYSTGPNVFSNKSIDIGARFMLEQLPKMQLQGRIADLGCGSGILGIETAMISPNAELDFYDESYQAVQATASNWRRIIANDQANFIWTDSMKDAEPNQYDVILNNPPFHQQHTVGDYIATSMFKDAHRCLKAGGKLYVVGNRHLGYHSRLRRWFKNVNLVASNSKFVVLCAEK